MLGFPSRLSASATGHFAASEVRYHVHSRRMMNINSSTGGNGTEVGFDKICMGKHFFHLFSFSYCQIQQNRRFFFLVFFKINICFKIFTLSLMNTSILGQFPQPSIESWLHFIGVFSSRLLYMII